MVCHYSSHYYEDFDMQHDDLLIVSIVLSPILTRERDDSHEEIDTLFVNHKIFNCL